MFRYRLCNETPHTGDVTRWVASTEVHKATLGPFCTVRELGSWQGQVLWQYICVHACARQHFCPQLSWDVSLSCQTKRAHRGGERFTASLHQWLVLPMQITAKMSWGEIFPVQLMLPSATTPGSWYLYPRRLRAPPLHWSRAWHWESSAGFISPSCHHILHGHREQCKWQGHRAFLRVLLPPFKWGDTTCPRKPHVCY